MVVVSSIFQDKDDDMRQKLLDEAKKLRNSAADRASRLVIGFLLAFFSINFSFAGNDTDLPALKIKEALALAVKYHPLISAKELEYQAAKSDLNAARWSIFPNASFSFRGFQKDDEQDLPDQEVLTVSQPVWTGGKLSGNVSLAKAKRDVAQFALVEAEQRLLEDTARAVIELGLAEAKINISLNNVKEHERLFGIIERRVQASTSPEVDLRLARARLAFSRSQLLQNSNAREVAKATLEQLIGRPVSRVTISKDYGFNKKPLPANEDAAVSFSPKIRKMRAEIDGLKALEKVSKSSLHPQLSIGYEKRYGELSANEDDEQVFLGLEFQPGAGFSALSSINVSQARKAALLDSLRALERDIRREVQITWREIAAAEMQLSPTNLLVESTADVVSSYLRQYTVGRKSWLDVLNAQRELVQARQSLEDHKASLNIASYKMQILVGDLNRKIVLNQNE